MYRTYFVFLKFIKKRQFFSTFQNKNKKEKYNDLENKYLYWNINKIKDEHLKKDKNNFFDEIENDELNENISEIVGVKTIPNNKQINEKIKKQFFKKENIDDNKLKEINNIFNPNLKNIDDNILSNESVDYIIKNNKINLKKFKENKNDQNMQNNFNINKENIKSINKKSFINKKMEKIKKNICNEKVINEKDNIKKHNESNINDDCNFKNMNNDNIFDYESFKKKGLYQDLTHEEYKYMNDLYIKKCDLDRKIRWFKMNNILNPLKEAKSIMNTFKLSKDEKTKNETSENNEIENSFIPNTNIKPFYENEGMFSNKIARICEQNKYDEIVSRIRMKIRKEKMENSKIMKEKIPNVARHILDPIKYHVNRRRVRLEKLLHNHLEQLLNCNNSYFKFYLLNGLSISIHHVEMKTPRSICNIVYSLLNNNITHESIKKKLEKVAFVLRRLLARKLQLGYTPPLRFIPLADQQQIKIKHLQYYKLYSKYVYPYNINDQQNKNQLLHYYSKDIVGF